MGKVGAQIPTHKKGVVKKKRVGVGRPRHAVTLERRRMVDAMVAHGMRQEDVARVLGIHKETLEKHYREELDTAAPKAHAKAASTLYRLAIGIEGDVEKNIEPVAPNITALIFYLKAQAKWTERHEFSGPNGGPIPLQAVPYDLSALSGDELRQLRTLMNRTLTATATEAGE